MKYSKLFLCIAASAISFNVYATKDASTNPDKYYLLENEVADSIALLPPPPALDSIDFLNDKTQYEIGLTLRDTPRGKLASNDADLHGDGVVNSFSKAFGLDITQKNLPQTYKLIQTMTEDAGDLSTRGAKNYYMRERPYAYYNTPPCNLKQMNELSTNGSYPSGHTAIGFATALVLAEINPANQDAILKRGYEIGQSRVICGYHWQSDVDAARIVAAAVVARLHANDNFNKQLALAKEEVAKKLKDKK